ncbi:MAG: ABC transporter ATP-binding protein [Rhodanobacter sp.]|nr:MAG: ABC transporter ATP-binding protein [Rhodanobacter sp.]TAM15109.1 MAG: ABC transporter ATP-binding protein [Rhodanobacter sp.]TAM36421.1 MAG: ABC transporter ATP-binding protein [Rhodanobacter sp.]
MTVAAANPVLQLDHVGRRRAGRMVVDEVTLELGAGQVLGLLGVNGAGKSTTLAMIVGALQPDMGTIRIGGKDLTEEPIATRQLVGWLPERAPVWPELTVAEHLATHGRLRGLRGTALRAAGDAALAQAGMTELRQRLAGALSQGQRQRLCLACALLHRPALLVLDEPANGLDPVHAAALKQTIRTLAQGGTAVILSTHLLAEATAVCDHVAILHEGRLRHVGAIAAGDQAALERTFFEIAMHGANPAARAA